ncbi:FtsX-like permease family protein [Streptosporangium soli]|nr:ABC transporter permease [Streptosporangium sp. KLBMP 9127]
MRTLELSWRLLRGGGRRELLGAGLTLVAVAVCTALLLFAAGINLAFDARSDREAWRNPVRASDAVAVQAVRHGFVADRSITVVELAALKQGLAPPPGLSRFPAPGEVWTSPALAALIERLPADRLGRRFPVLAGLVIGDEGLIHPGELVAVVGRAPGDPAMTWLQSAESLLSTGPTRIAGFGGEPSDMAVGYSILALIATVLMIVPLLVFGGASARLTVARRDRRLAALRLVGATPGQVVGMTAAEAMFVAVLGALLGTVVYGVAVPLLAGIPIAGGTWFAWDLLPGPQYVIGVLLAVPLLVGLSAVVGLRRVVVSPLGVAKRETPPGMRFVRVVVTVALVAAAPAVASGTASVAALVLAVALPFLSIAVLGPWVVGVIGRITARSARGPARLLAGRRLMDDPRSAWRTVSGVVLTGFVAGFIGLLTPASGLLGDESAGRLQIEVPAARVAETADKAGERLRSAGLAGRVETSGKGDHRLVTVVLATEETATVDRARTALAGLAPGHSATSPADDQHQGEVMLADVRTGTIVVLTVSFLVAIASAGITAASSILDRRQTYALLRLAGTPLSVLDRARRAETLVPLAVLGGGAILIGMSSGAALAPGALNGSGMTTLLVCVVLGFCGVIGAGALSRPLLRSVTDNPAPRPD